MAIYVACVALYGAAFTNIALAGDDDAMKPAAMSTDHIGMKKKPMTKKHVMKKPMMQPDAMSSDHIAPDAPKQ